MIRKRIAFLASGGGSNFQALLDAMAKPNYPAVPVLLFSDKAQAGALERAKKAGVAVAHLDPKAFAGREAYDQAVVEVLKRATPDFICLAGYMRILTPVFIAAFHQRILNIHPALLPAFGGPGMYGHHVHEAVVKAGVPKSGATVHWVTEGVDAGPIIAQAEVPVLPNDTAETLATRVLEQEHLLYPKALKMVCEKAV